LNEILFFLHVFLLILAIFFALRLGRAALLALLGLQVIVSNLFVTKQMIFFGFHITCSDVYAVGALFSLNLIQEYFGKEATKRAIYIAFFLLFFFVVMSQIHLIYVPSPHDGMQENLMRVFGMTPRLTLASFIVAFFCQHLDMRLYGFLQQKNVHRAMAFRFGGAALISQLIDTVLFSFFGLYGFVHSVIHIIIVSYLVKVCVIFSMTPFTLLAKKVVRDPVHF